MEPSYPLTTSPAAIRLDELTRHSFLYGIVANVVIYDIVFAHCSPATLIRFSWTCKEALNSVRAYFRRAFNVNRHLSRFFPDPVAFRALQARTTTLISGSCALQFLDRTFYPESDLDIYVPMARIREVVKWLIDIGYEFRPAIIQPADFEAAVVHMEESFDMNNIPGVVTDLYPIRGIAGVFTLLKPTPGEGSLPSKIQAIVPQRCPIQLVLGFHCSTCLPIVSRLDV